MPVGRGADMSGAEMSGAEAAGAEPSGKGRELLRITGTFGAVLGYGCLAAFVCLVGVQTYRWIREGEWTHVSLADGVHAALLRCCVREGAAGRLAAFVHWLEAPADWTGLHKVMEVLPASLVLFALSILGNSLFIYCSDRNGAVRPADPGQGA